MKHRVEYACTRLTAVLMIALGVVVLPAVVVPTVVLLTTATAVHAGGPFCVSHADCDDGVFCNGVESCNLGTNTCVALSSCPPSFPPTVCNEATDSCDPVECISDFDCDDDVFCNGVESCDLGTNTCVALSSCPPSIPPTVCNEATDSCDPVDCISDFDCDDGVFCNGVESCNLDTNTCVAVSSCPPSIPPTVCNETTDSCVPELIFQDGFELGNTSRWSSRVP